MRPADGAAKHYRPYAEYLSELLHSRAAEPRDDLASYLINGGQDSPPLCFDDALYLLRGTLSAGFDATRDTIAGAVLKLMEHQALWDACADDDRTLRHVSKNPSNGGAAPRSNARDHTCGDTRWRAVAEGIAPSAALRVGQP